MLKHILRKLSEHHPAINIPFNIVMNQLIKPYLSNYAKDNSNFSVVCFKEDNQKCVEILDLDNTTNSFNDGDEVSPDNKYGIGITKITHVIFILLGSVNCFAETSKMTMDPNKRLEFEISQDSMNRIAVANDRITQVFGDNDAYETQSEENTGQIFIKPMMENGDKPLSLTIITEKNMTQDLTLLPVQKEASTLILKNTQALKSGVGEGDSNSQSSEKSQAMNSVFLPGLKGIDQSYSGNFSERYGVQSLNYQESLLDSMKKLTSKTLSPLELDYPPERKHGEEFSVVYVNAYAVGGLKGFIFEIKNLTETPISLNEDRFYIQNDLALCLDKQELKSKETTYLYVLTR